MEVDVRFDSGRISIATETIAIKGETVLGLNGLIGGNADNPFIATAIVEECITLSVVAGGVIGVVTLWPSALATRHRHI